ncbi:hypothetical protein Dimus_029209 [Dionaea muscipula]
MVTVCCLRGNCSFISVFKKILRNVLVFSLVFLCRWWFACGILFLCSDHIISRSDAVVWFVIKEDLQILFSRTSRWIEVKVPLLRFDFGPGCSAGFLPMIAMLLWSVLVASCVMFAWPHVWHTRVSSSV